MQRFFLELRPENAHIVAELRSERGQVLASGVSGRSIADLASDEAGRTLGEVALPGEVLRCLELSFPAGRLGLAFRLPDELQRFAWEAAFVEHGGIGRLALHPAIRLSRWQEPREEPKPKQAYRMLVAFADPQTAFHPRLEKAEDEADAVIRAAGRLGGIEIETLPHATAASLARRLSQGAFDIVHLIAHAEARPSGGVLILEGSSANEASTLYADECARLLAGATLVTLSACQSLGGPSTLGAQLARSGVPAVVGMQSSVQDAVSHQFFRAFYPALADRQSLDEALFEARTAIGGAGSDWAAPILLTAFPGHSLASRERQPAEERRGNLPRSLTTFVGRAAEIERIVDLVRAERLVVLLGSGGIGKTRLSIEAGRSFEKSLAHGSWQAPLDAISDSGHVAEAVGRVFGIRDAGGNPLEQRILDFLSDRQLLLILDNCEHVLPGCRDLVKKILDACPEIRIMATSRQVLGTGAESVFRVPGLSYPSDPPATPQPGCADAVTSAYEAVKLLAVRSRQADAGFALDDENVNAFGKIAKRLDGIPLALELAASRVRSLTPHQILDRLIVDLAWLDVENQGAVPRQKTLRATLDWSYRLTSAREKTAFNCMGVFADAFSLAGITEVASSAGLSPAQVMDALTSLVDKSLVVAEPREHEMRYRLLDTCRQYALEKLEAEGGTGAARDRQADFIAAFVRDAFEGMFHRTDHQKQWLASLAAEHDNCIAALEWCLGGGGAPMTAAAIVKNLFGYWFQVRSFELAIRWIRRTVQQLSVEVEAERPFVIELLTLGGAASVYSGDPAGLDLARRAMALAEEHEPDLAMNVVAGWFAECAYMTGEFDLAFGLYERIRAYLRDLGKDEGSAQLNVAAILEYRGELDRAETEFRSFLDKQICRKDQRSAGYALCHLGHIDAKRGGGEYRSLYAAGIGELAGVGDRGALAEFLPLASICFLPDDPDLAASIQGFAAKLLEETGARPDRMVGEWGAEVEGRTAGILGSRYAAAHKDGRTMSLDAVLEHFQRQGARGSP